MDKFKRLLLVVPLLVVFGLVLPNGVNAAEFKTGDYTLEKEEILEDDLYVGGDTVIISGIVDGDALVSGNNITVDGTVTGDLYVAGNLVSVQGNVYGNVFAAGSNVTLEGTYGGNVLVGSAIANISADVSKDLMVGAWRVTLDGTVGDDVRVGSGELISEALVGGDFILSSDSHNVEEIDVTGELVIDEVDAVEIETPEIDTTILDNIFVGFSFVSAIIGFIGMYLVGAFLILAAPTKTYQFEKKINSSWEDALKSFAIGLLVLFGSGIPLFVLLITGVGTSLAVLIIGILFFLTTFGVVWAEIAIGGSILGLFDKKDDKKFLSLLVGRGVTVFVKFLPFLRLFYSVVLMSMTVGAVVRSKADLFREAKVKTKKKSK